MLKINELKGEEKMKKVRKYLAFFMIVCMMASFVPAAFADDVPESGSEFVVEITDTGNGVEGVATVDGTVLEPQKADGSIIGIDLTAYDPEYTTPGYTEVRVYTTGETENSVNYKGEDVSTTTVTVNGDVNGEVYVSGDDANIDGRDDVTALTVNGDITSEYTGIWAETYYDTSENGTAASIVTTTGSVSSTKNIGVSVYTYGEKNGVAETSITVGGSVTGKYDGIYIDSEAYDEASAQTNVTVGENVTAKADGGYAQGIIISAYTDLSGEETDAKPTNTVNVEVGGGVFAEGVGAMGIQVYGVDEPFTGTATVTVNEDVKATATEGGAFGLNVNAAGEGSAVTLDVGGVAASSTGEKVYVAGVDVYAEGKASVTVTVGEDGISAKGGNTYNNTGASLRVEGDSTASLSVAGDVTADGEGIVLVGYADPEDEEDVPGHIDVFVEGTVSGGENSILLPSSLVSSALESSNVDLAVWKAELNKDGHVVGTTDFDRQKAILKEALDAGYMTQEVYEQHLAELKEVEETSSQNAAAIEESIKYLIRVEKNGNGAYKEYKGLDFTNAEMVNDYYAATEATEVTLKSMNGYKVISVVDSENGANTYVTKDANGVYHILIPKGGGVWLNVKVEKIEASSGPDYVPVIVLGKVTSRDGSVLTLFNDKSYTLAYADGTKERGSWKFAGDQLVFTNPDKVEIAPEVDGDGNATYTFKEGSEFVFTAVMLTALRSGATF